MIDTIFSKKIKLGIAYPKVATNTIFDKFFHQHSATPFPRIINCFITENCNFNCPMCHVVESRKKRLSLSQLDFKDLKKIIDEGSKYGISLQLSGGEPLLHSEIIKIIKYAHQKKVVTGLVTNGLLLKKYAKDLVSSGLDFLAISLDGPNEATQYQRGYIKGSFNQIIEGIKEVVKFKGKNSFPNIRVATVITKNNLKNFEKIYSVINNIGVDQWSISHYFYYYNQIAKDQTIFCQKYHTGSDVWGQNLGDKKNYFNLSEIKILKQKLAKISSIKKSKIIITLPKHTNLKKYYTGVNPSYKSRCVSPFQQIFIRGNGDAEICHGFIIGNIKTQKLFDLWHQLKVNQFRKIINQQKTIPACFRCCALDIKFNQ
jgi:MoaA/NifB/PqqE/SkfB family radical SAM enzyme